jgi:hypothetical protein
MIDGKVSRSHVSKPKMPKQKVTFFRRERGIQTSGVSS